ncbi:hypothetical protein NIES4071_89400 [Calothrix sp. NIES-4071]|nr:hypothetical protein NIES4071_89400 [Calothrix sp. NIES-4071]BAZ63207.1 hypothetical protein NIES4105_89330 [Calothrix sp. NIES-4105]
MNHKGTKNTKEELLKYKPSKYFYKKNPGLVNLDKNISGKNNAPS